ncbi:hypothetical protein WA026_003207, partial [Henosepilachna vigintioctopunctata]
HHISSCGTSGDKLIEMPDFSEHREHTFRVPSATSGRVRNRKGRKLENRAKKRKIRCDVGPGIESARPGWLPGKQTPASPCLPMPTPGTPIRRAAKIVAASDCGHATCLPNFGDLARSIAKSLHERSTTRFINPQTSQSVECAGQSSEPFDGNGRTKK